MDNSSDSSITFDKDGHCNYCNEAFSQIGKIYFPNEEGNKRLGKIIKEIKVFGVGKKYDCVMGISGGLDSSYLAYLGHKWGLRILGIHIDDGFDTEISKNNIMKLVKATGIDLITIHPDAEQFNALIKAYMIASVPNLAVPQDNILFAYLYDYARKNNIKYFLSGGNFALEGILQKGNSYNAYDTVNIYDINQKFNSAQIDKLKFISIYRRAWDTMIMGLKTIRPLNYIDYNRDRAFKELNEFCGFEYYGAKHLENILTAFIQLYWFPKKFGVDKRTSHLSSMIVSGQMTRDEALAELSKPVVADPIQMKKYLSIIKDNLNISDLKFEEIIHAPPKSHYDYKIDKLQKFIRSMDIISNIISKYK